jgi:hypothetical protein
MSWHYSLALVEDCSLRGCLAGELSAQLKATGTHGASLAYARTMEAFVYSQSGTTFVPSTARFGEDVLTWYLAGFRVKPTPPQLAAALQRTTYGRKCGESWQMSLPGTYLPKTRQSSRLITRPATSKRWVTKPTVLRLLRLIWERRMKVSAINNWNRRMIPTSGEVDAKR